ncbi:hypothetical protein CSA56_02870 [candidate division KSB3 bacterium]|uniref:Uncharacterized protein n=1 Tax=candidate division KSB3 bacterium TaxID=2044937 RepID=A0A2G6KJH1_9BACT|nr:MAG: hypothetical protein CSA56_02870 [candidate division KSB3 bacterium]
MMKKYCILIHLLVLCLFAVSGSYAQSPGEKQPSKLQLAVEPEDIILTKDIFVGSADRTIHLILRETSGVKPAKLELAARPFTEINSGNMVDAGIVQVELSEQQAMLEPGGLARIEATIGGFQEAGSYLGGMTIHDTVSGERKEVSVRVSVKDAWPVPVAVLLVSVLIASGVNHWTQKGRRKNRLDQKIAELRKTIEAADRDFATFLIEAERFLEKALAYNQDYQFEQTEAALTHVEQNLLLYEQRKHDSEVLRQRVQTLLSDIRGLGEADPQSMKLSGELIQVLPKIQTDFEETAALVKQFDMFFEAYRMARRDVLAAREKLAGNLEYVKKADRSKIDMMLVDIERLLQTAESMSAIDDANALLRKVAFELSPEKINENMFRSQRFQTQLDGYHDRVKQVTGSQVKRIVGGWYEKALHALEDNRYEDVEEALQKLSSTLKIVEKIKQAERRIKGRDTKATDLRRILRECKQFLEGESWDGIERAEYDVAQVLEMLDGVRTGYDPFPSVESHTFHPEAESVEKNSGDIQSQASAEEGTQLRPLTPDDLQRHFERILEDAAGYPKLREKMLTWRSYCHKLLEFEELNEMFEYLEVIQEELVLYARVRTIRTEAEEQGRQAVLRLAEQAEQLLLLETSEDRGAFHRAEVLADAAKALLDEETETSDFEQVISNIRSPRLATNLVTYGTLASYFVISTALGFQILYAPNHAFGASVFEDYFALVLWAFGLQGAKMTVMNVYEAYFKKEG